MKFDFLSLLTIIIVFQLLFISLFLFTSKRGKSLSNKLLGLFFFFIAINFVDILFTVQGLQDYYHQIAQLDLAVLLLLGPLFFFYTKTIVYQDFRFRIKSIFHFFPFVIVATFLTISYNSITPESQKQMLNEINSFKLPLVFTLFVYSIYVHILAYLFLSWREVKRYRKVLRENYSELSKLNLKWLKYMINSLVMLVLIALFQSFVPYVFGETYIYIVLIALILFVFYFINRVIFKALNQPGILSGIKEDSKSMTKYAGSLLKDYERQEHKMSLLNFMENEKPYLKPELNLEDLAKSLSVTEKILSQVINQSFDKSFFDFINSCRIEEAKNILQSSSDSKLTILEVIYQSGFNSKSSFNTCFKKMTRMTPTEFRRSLKN